MQSTRRLVRTQAARVRAPSRDLGTPVEKKERRKEKEREGGKGERKEKEKERKKDENARQLDYETDASFIFYL